MDNRRKIRFWPLLGIILAADGILALAYTLIGPGWSGRAFSDSLCVSALLLGLAATVPALLDIGRGIGVGMRMSSNTAEQRAVLQKEHQQREQGMVITFVLATAMLIIALLSFLISLW